MYKLKSVETETLTTSSNITTGDSLYFNKGLSHIEPDFRTLNLTDVDLKLPNFGYNAEIISFADANKFSYGSFILSIGRIIGDIFPHKTIELGNCTITTTVSSPFVTMEILIGGIPSFSSEKKIILTQQEGLNSWTIKTEAGSSFTVNMKRITFNLFENL